MKNLPQEFGSGMARGGGLASCKGRLGDTQPGKRHGHSSEYVASSVVRDVPEGASVLVTGGGAKNEVLMGAIQRLSASQNLRLFRQHWLTARPWCLPGWDC